MSGTGLSWPALVQPYRDRLEEWFGTPQKLHASFDSAEELVALLAANDNTLSALTRGMIADAIMEWQEDTKSTVANARREAKRRLSETFPCNRSAELSLQQHYNQIASQSPLALLPALRKRKLAVDRTIDRGARATEEARLRKEYALRLAAVFQEADLPVCKILAGVSDAEEASLSVIETVGRVPESNQISQDPTWQAQLKSYTADLVASSAPEQPAHMFTTCMLVSLEILVCSSDEPPYLRALGFVVLLMVWGSLRADDVQGLLPQTMQLDERGLAVELARSKTTGPDRRTRSVKVFIERRISLTGRDWLREGWALWRDFDYQRDYLVLKANNDFSEPIEKPVSASTVALYVRKVLSSLKTPKREGKVWKANGERLLLPGHTASLFTGHSARNYLSSVGAAIGVDPRELDYLGRWKVGGEGSATYIRTSRQIVHRLQLHIAEALVTGQPKQYIEVEAIKAVTDYATQVGESESQVRRRHIIFEGSKGLGGTWPTLHVEADAAAPPSPDHLEVAAGDRGQYFVVTSRTTGLRRLHMVGCYVKPENCYHVKFVEHVNLEDVDSICKDCRARMKAQAGQEESDPSSSDTGASEAMASDDEKRQLITGRQQIAGVVAAWELARDVITKETETRAEAKVLGQPRILQVTERQAMIKAVVAVHGQLGESETPSAEYLALKCEECEVNEPQASTLDAITSKKSTLTTSIQSSLDASGRIHITQHKAKSELPTTTEAYRKVLRVEAFTWLCMAARFKSKQWLQGLKLLDFDHFVNYILGEKVAQLSVPTSHQPNDVPTLSPPWHVVLAYEHRLRKEAFRLVNEEDQTLSAALATVISSAELKETYFTTPLALSIIERPRKWYKGKGKDKDGKGLGKDPKGGYKGKEDKGGKGGKTATSDPALKGLTLVWRTSEGRDICFAFNSQGCSNPKCERLHVCRVKGCYQEHSAREHKQKAGKQKE
ncbi:unnamed protein product [Symbiodinium microadriaticum]|nr:unnamed protein product [Symbiodinium microadriaticum]